jgi:hypothetical protein
MTARNFSCVVEGRGGAVICLKRTSVLAALVSILKTSM